MVLGGIDFRDCCVIVDQILALGPYRWWGELQKTPGSCCVVIVGLSVGRRNSGRLCLYPRT